jgi:tight adherence protein C
MAFLIENQTMVFVILGLIVAILGLGLLIYGTSGWLRGGNKIASRLDHYVAEQSQKRNPRQLKRILPREISGSFFSRTVVPIARKSSRLVEQLTPGKRLEKLDHDLAIAGNPLNLRAQEFFGLQFMLFLVGIFIALLYNLGSALNLVKLVISGLAILFLLLIPRYWLNGKVKGVQEEIRLELPDALDMLSVCASAGLGFDQSLQKISVYWQTPLGFEIKRVTQEMEMGVTRAQALRNMSERLSVDDLTRFISIIIQAENMGMSYADVLHSQAVQMRILRQYRAREIANRLPAKMIIPLAILIFPALIAVILGPVIPTFLDLFR